MLDFLKRHPDVIERTTPYCDDVACINQNCQRCRPAYVRPLDRSDLTIDELARSLSIWDSRQFCREGEKSVAPWTRVEKFERDRVAGHLLMVRFQYDRARLTAAPEPRIADQSPSPAGAAELEGASS